MRHVRRNINRNVSSARHASTPAPVGGWNTRDALDAMPSEDAVILDNWIPTTGKVTVREGFSDHASGVGSGNVDTLVELHTGSTQKLIAAGGGSIYDATSVGAAVSLGSGFTINNWQTANFSGRVFFVNGTDAPQDYNGTTLSATSWSGTGLTISNLVGVNVFKNRIFFWENNSQDFWYAAVNAVSGTLTRFPLSRVSQLGGNLVMMGTWTIDGGDGADDYAVFVMSSGEAIVYQGTDPGVAADWSLVGIYRIGRPFNVRAIIKYGGDLIITTTDDYVSLSQVLKTGTGTPSKLSGAVRDASVQSGSFGWQSILYRKGSFLLFNVPTSSNTYEQHVVNTTTGAACRFTGLEARCWSTYNGDLYFGTTDGTVKKYGGVTNDNGSNIAANGLSAWNDFNIPNRKRIVAIRPSLQVQGDLFYSLGVGFDFNIPSVEYVAAITSVQSLWDTATWDVSLWSNELITDSKWRVASGTGESLLTRISVTSQQTVSWIRTDYRISVGSGL